MEISLKFLPGGPIYCQQALVQVMVWFSTGETPLPDSVLINVTIWLHCGVGSISATSLLNAVLHNHISYKYSSYSIVCLNNKQDMVSLRIIFFFLSSSFLYFLFFG